MLESVDLAPYGARPQPRPSSCDDEAPWFLPRSPSMRARADAVLAAGLAADSLLNPSQRDNLRAMADDLFARRAIWKSVPVRVLFEFNRRCNVKCVHCDIRRAGTKELGLETFERLLDEIGHGSLEIMPLVGGEPTLAPIEGAAALCRKHGQWLNFITNGILFDRAFFEPIADVTARVQLSFPAHDKATFDRVMPGADFSSVVDNVRDTAAIGRQTGAHVLACIVPMFDMLDRLHEYVRFVADLGVTRVIIQKLYPQTKRKDRLDPAGADDPGRRRDAFAKTLDVAAECGVYVETNFSDLWADPRNVAEPSRFDVLQATAELVALYAPEFCISTSMQSLIEHDGTVLPCCRDKIPLGNVNHQSFGEIWNGDAMQKLRHTHFARDPRPNCKTCRAFYLGHP